MLRAATTEWSRLDVELPSLTAYNPNRTPSSVPADNPALVFDHRSALGIAFYPCLQPIFPSDNAQTFCYAVIA